MKLTQLRSAADKAKRNELVARRKALTLRRVAGVAKEKSDEARIQYKRLRKLAKQCKKFAAAAEEQAQERLGLWDKARKRLAKALRSQPHTKSQ